MKKVALLLTVTVVFSLGAWAGGKAKKYSVKFHSDTEVNGAVIKAGQYEVAVADGAAVVLNGRKELAKAPVSVVENDEKYTANSLLYQADSKTLKEIRLGGTKTKLVLGDVAAGGGAGSK
jgi:hypothetical protein